MNIKRFEKEFHFTLLSMHVLSPGNYYVAADLDLTCVKMTIANFLLHGVVGEVLWMNSLT